MSPVNCMRTLSSALKLQRVNLPVAAMLKNILVVVGAVAQNTSHDRPYEVKDRDRVPCRRGWDSRLGALRDSMICCFDFPCIIIDNGLATCGALCCILEGFRWLGNNDHLTGD